MKKKYLLDDVDEKILNILKHNGRIQWREIGEEIHMTGQAVGERIKKLSQLGIIKGFYTDINDSIYADINIDFVTIILTSGNHTGFTSLVSSIAEVTETYKTSGNGCYLIRVETKDKETFNDILESLQKYGNYQINNVIKKIK